MQVYVIKTAIIINSHIFLVKIYNCAINVLCKELSVNDMIEMTLYAFILPPG